ncbi:putative inactive receptor kinase [Quercus suber]|uniref:Inactive receptor kinase n=1 Tax=Quercus suber TaxID=58331 RepID=A0AAW0J8B6_QUESU
MKIFLILSLASIFCFSQSNSIEGDVMCLQGVKNSLSDPANKLSSWTFTNSSVASICKLQGVVCWNEKKNRLINLQLPTMQLSGEVPESLKYCRSLQTLYLSNNSISGPIPSQICNWLPRVSS